MSSSGPPAADGEVPRPRPTADADASRRRSKDRRRVPRRGEALINRNFTLIWTGQAFSDIASEMTSLALPLVVLASTHSVAAAGLVGTAVGFTQLIAALPGGLIADIADRRRLMMLCDAGRAVIALLLALALWTGHFTTAVAVAAAIATAVLSKLFGPAQGGLLRQVVPAGRRREAVTRNLLRSNAAIAVGPPLGGLLLGLGAPLAFALDAVSYLFSWGLLSRIRLDSDAPPKAAPPATHPAGRGLRHLGVELTLGLRWVLRRRALMALLALVAYINLLGWAVELIAVVDSSASGSHPLSAGVALAAMGCGGILGGFCTGWVLKRVRPSMILLGVSAEWLLLMPFTATGRQPVTIAAVFLLVLALPLVTSLLSLTVTTDAPAELQGRVGTAVTLMGSSIAWMGPAATGYLITAHSARTTALVLAAPLILALLALVGSHRIRADLDSLGRDDKAEPANTAVVART